MAAAPEIRLVLDLARRRWKAALFWGGFQPFNLVSIAQHKRWAFSIDPLAIALLTAAFLLHGTLKLFDTRELYQLPVSRRTWRQSLWLVRVIALPGLVGVAIALRQQESWALVWSDRCFVYPVTLMIASAVMIRVAPRLPALGAPLFGLLLLFGPFVAAPHLPHVFADFNVWWLIGYAAAATCGIGSFYVEPPIVARSFVRPVKPVQITPYNSSRVPAETSREARLTGLSLALYSQASRRLMGIGVAVASAVALWVLTGIFQPVSSLPQALINTAFLPFAEPRFDLAYVALSMILPIVLLVDFGARPLNLLVLRSLPLRGWQVASLPIVSGVATAVAVYATQVLLYALTGRHFVTWRIDVLVVAAATLALVDLLRFVSASSGIGSASSAIGVALILFAVPLFRTDLHMILTQSTYIYAGSALLACTALASWHLTARSNYGYHRARLRSPALGAPPQS